MLGLTAAGNFTRLIVDGGYRRLGELELRSRRLVAFSFATLTPFAKLRRVDLRDDSLRSVNLSEIEHLPRLRHVQLSSNNISTILGNNSLASSALTQLHARDNLLAFISSPSCDFLSSHRTLVGFQLAANRLEAFDLACLPD